MSVMDHMPYEEVYQEVRRNRRKDSQAEAIAQLLAGLGQGLNAYGQGQQQRRQETRADQRYTDEQAYRQTRDAASDQRWDQQFGLQQQRYDREDSRFSAGGELSSIMEQESNWGEDMAPLLFGLAGAPEMGPPSPGQPAVQRQPGAMPEAPTGLPDQFSRASPEMQGQFRQHRQKLMSSQDAVRSITPVLQAAMSEGVIDEQIGAAYLTHVRQNPAAIDNVLGDIQQRRTASMKGTAEEEHRSLTLQAIQPNAQRISQLSPRHAGEVAMLLDEYQHGQIKASEVNRRLADIEDGVEEQQKAGGLASWQRQELGPEYQDAPDEAVGPAYSSKLITDRERLRASTRAPNFKSTGDYAILTRAYDDAKAKMTAAEKAVADAQSKLAAVESPTVKDRKPLLQARAEASTVSHELEAAKSALEQYERTSGRGGAQGGGPMTADDGADAGPAQEDIDAAIEVARRELGPNATPEALEQRVEEILTGG